MTRIALGAFGDPGHAFPILAIGEALVSRDAQVSVQTAANWESQALSIGAHFSPAPEFPVVRMSDGALKPFEAVFEALPATRTWLEEFSPDVVVHDTLTLAPALAAEQLGIPTATVIPHVNPVTAVGDPPYGIGIRPARTPIGRFAWKALNRPIDRGLRQGELEYSSLRKRAGLAPRSGFHAALSRNLVMVATYPQLEYSASLDERFRITGPLFWEPSFPEVELPEGDRPLVMVAPSTAQDPEHELLLASLKGLGDLDCRVISTWNRRPLKRHREVPSNTHLVEWLSYSKTMPRCSVVVSHAGHGTLARTLQAGAVPVLIPHAGDQFENAARADALGLGVRLPNRLLSARTLALAVERALGDTQMRARCMEVADWSRTHDGAETAAELVLGLCDDCD
jgi:MGT family glycosyltransferase